MKRILVILVALIGFGVNAQTTGTCGISSVPGAYVNAESKISAPSTVTVKVVAYGVQEGSVICEIKYQNSQGNEKTAEKLISFKKNPYTGDVEGKVDITTAGIATQGILKTTIYNATCSSR